MDCKEIKPVNLKEMNPEYSLGGLMLKLKLQYFGHLMRRVDSLEKTLMLGKIEEEKGMTEDDGPGAARGSLLLPQDQPPLWRSSEKSLK